MQSLLPGVTPVSVGTGLPHLPGCAPYFAVLLVPTAPRVPDPAGAVAATAAASTPRAPAIPAPSSITAVTPSSMTAGQLAKAVPGDPNESPMGCDALLASSWCELVIHAYMKRAKATFKSHHSSRRTLCCTGFIALPAGTGAAAPGTRSARTPLNNRRQVRQGKTTHSDGSRRHGLRG